VVLRGPLRDDAPHQLSWMRSSTVAFGAVGGLLCAVPAAAGASIMAAAAISRNLPRAVLQFLILRRTAAMLAISSSFPSASECRKRRLMIISPEQVPVPDGQNAGGNSSQGEAVCGCCPRKMRVRIRVQSFALPALLPLSFPTLRKLRTWRSALRHCFGAVSLEFKGQAPFTRHGSSIDRRRCESPLARGLQRFIGKVSARSA